MNIKELESNLGISRANIRFYEKEGLIQPRRTESNYRDYSPQDVEKLKKIMIFRKLNFSIQQIKEMQTNALDLSCAIDTTIEKTKETIQELNGALEIAEKMKSERTTFQNMNVESYWDLINKKQQAGSAFINIDRDYLLFELNLLDRMLKWAFLYDFKNSRKRHGAKIAVLILFCLCLVRGLSKKFLWHGSFWEGLLYPLFVFAACSLIVLPLYILSRRKPKIAAIIAKFLLFFGIVILALIALLVVILLLNSFLHFLF